MATRVLTMSARLGPAVPQLSVAQDEPVFAQLKPVLGAAASNPARGGGGGSGGDAALFPGAGGGGGGGGGEEQLKHSHSHHHNHHNHHNHHHSHHHSQPPAAPQAQPPAAPPAPPAAAAAGSRLPTEELVQTRCEMEKYLTPQLPPVSIIPEHKKYRRDSASVVDQFFTDNDGLPYSINMNVFLPDISHLRTGLYKTQRPCVTHIKTEPVTIFSHQSETTAPPPAPTQALPEFTSIFSSHQTAAPEVNNIFIKQELPTPDLHLSVPPQQGHLYQLLNTPDLDMPSSTNQTAVMDTLNVSMSAAMAGLNTHTSAVPQTAMKQFQGLPPCTYTMPSQFLPQQATYFPPSPPSSEPGSPDRQAEMLQNLTPPPSYAATIASKLAIHNPNLPATLPVSSQNIQPVRYNRRSNPDLEKRRIHYCDYPGE